MKATPPSPGAGDREVEGCNLHAVVSMTGTVRSGYSGESLDNAQSFAEVVVVESRRKEAGSKARCLCRRLDISSSHLSFPIHFEGKKFNEKA